VGCSVEETLPSHQTVSQNVPIELKVSSIRTIVSLSSHGVCSEEPNHQITENAPYGVDSEGIYTITREEVRPCLRQGIQFCNSCHLGRHRTRADA